MSAPAPTNTTVTPAATSSATTAATASTASILPKPVTLLQAAKLAMDQDKPILLDYYRESATNAAFLGEDPESKDKILIKTKDDFTSIIKKLYRPEADGDYITLILINIGVIILGIIGSHSKVSEQDLHEKVLTPILQETGRIPDRILIPTEGTTSYYIQDWAESLHIQTQLFHTDWKKNGKAAQIFRDNRIITECTHALVFLSPRSERYTKLAETMTPKQN